MFKKENFIPPKKNILSFYFLIFFPIFLILGNLSINFFYVAFAILAILDFTASFGFMGLFVSFFSPCFRIIIPFY